MFLPILAAVFLVTSYAQSGWVASYQQYSEAMAAGNTVAALEHAEDAWLGAKEALPPSENRALLAQNFGELAFTSDPVRALPALEDAVDMADQGFGLGNIPRETLVFLRDTARAISSSNDRTARTAVNSFDDVLPTELARDQILVARLLLSRQLLTNSQFDLAADFAGAFANDLTGMKAPMDTIVTARQYQSLALAYDLPEGVTTTGSRLGRNNIKPYVDKLLAQIVVLREIQEAIGIQNSIAEFNPLLADVWAQELFLNGYIQSVMNDEEAEERIAALGQRMPLVYRPPGCSADLEWVLDERRFPSGSGNYNGVVVYGFDLDDKGKPINLRVLSEFPEDKYGEAYGRTVQRSRLSVEEHEGACRNGWLDAAFLFYQLI